MHQESAQRISVAYSEVNVALRCTVN